MAHFKLIIQYPQSKDVGEGSLSISKDGCAEFYEGNAEFNSRIMATMINAKIVWAAAAGILISGFEHDGVDKSGRMKAKYQEWLLCHLHPNK